jgi:hemoglobin
MIDMTPTPYERIGGASAVRALVDRFYDLMDSLPEAAAIRAMHGKSLGSSRNKMFMFLSGWLGGPDDYQAGYGQPRLRSRHLPFVIGLKERDQWMLCMNRALAEQVADRALRDQLGQTLFQVADFMRNRPECGWKDASSL